MNEATTPLPDAKLLAQYGCGPIRFTGDADALYERHLLFDNVVAPAATGPRERFEAVARSVRDVLSQRWVLTDSTYDRQNPKRIYYLSMEFLIGRLLSNNVVNLLLGPLVQEIVAREDIDCSVSSSKNLMPAWGTADSGVWRLAFLIRWRRCSCRPWATGCAMNTACSNSRSETAGSTKSRTTGCADRTPGRSRVPMTLWKSSSIARSRCRTGACSPSPAAGLH
jgi:hypothetical protein